MYHLNFLCHDHHTVAVGVISFIVNVFRFPWHSILQTWSVSKMTTNKEIIKKMYEEFTKRNVGMVKIQKTEDLG